MTNKKNGLIEKYNNMPKPVKASFLFLICMILQKGISVLTTPVFTRLMGAESYGEYSMFNSWESIISVFVTMRLTSGVYTQGLVKYEDRRDEFAAGMQGLSIFIITCYFLVYLLFRNQFNAIFSLNTYEMISMFVIFLTDGIFTFWLCEQRVDYKYKKVVAISLVVSVFKPLAGIFAVLKFKDMVTARIISIALINLIFYTPFLITKIKLKKPFFSKKIWKYGFMFNLPLIPHYLSQRILNKADCIMIGKMIGMDKAGIYNLSYSLAMIMLIINDAMTQTMTPWMYRKMRDKKVEDIKGVAYIALAFVAVLNLFLIVFAPEIIKIFAPPEFKEAVWAIPPIAMSSIFIFSYDLFSAYEFYYEKTSFVMIASILGAVLNIGLNYVFIQQFGFIAAGYTTLICYIFYAVGHYMFMNKICRENFNGQKPYDLRILLLIYIVFMTIGFGIMLTYEYFVIRMVIIGLLFFIVWLFRKKIKEFVNQILSIRKEN